MQYFTCCGPGSRGAICPNATAHTRARTIGSTAGLGEESGSVFSTRWRQNRATVCTWSIARLGKHIARPAAQKGGEESGDWHQPWWADHENPCGRRWQGSTTELHRHWWTGPRLPGRRRSLEYASIAARRDRRQGL